MAESASKVKTEIADSQLLVNIKKEYTSKDQTVVPSSNSIASQILEENYDLSHDKERAGGNIQHGRKRKRKRIHRVRGKRRGKRLKLKEENLQSQVSSNNTALELSSSEAEDEYCLTVSNLPNNWSYIEIKNYIDTEVCSNK